ncbi:MAG: HIRAN domain-containing protein [Eubacteriales bacterium]
MTKAHLTITGFSQAYGFIPFEEGQIIYLKKEPENPYDAEAIVAHLPYIGNVGYVANSPRSVIRGTMSAGRLYERFDADAVAKVEFITGTQIICRLLPAKKARKYLEMYDSFEAELRELDLKMSEEDGSPLMVHIFDRSKSTAIGITPLWEK